MSNVTETPFIPHEVMLVKLKDTTS